MADSALAGFFTPRNIALVGASDRSAWSQMVAACFDLFGHTGKLYAVNRGGKEAHGFPGYTSCTEIPDPVDAAFVYVPAAAVVEALHDCAAAGIRNAVILSSGFAEAGEEGAAMQEDVARTAREVLPLAEKGGDEATVDLLVQRMQVHEKTAWMLRSLLS